MIVSVILSALFVALGVAQSNEGCAGLRCSRCLTRFDFQHGTFRIVNPGKYCLGEDIIFDPTPASVTPISFDFSWFPHDSDAFPACDHLKGGAFALGYFAALSIESDDVEVDLNGYDMSSSLSFYLQQRFFSLIEIGTAPYMQGFGPANFGPADSHRNIYIHDGSLGLSSHHGVHSNEAHDVRLERLTIAHFGVCGVQFNGFTDIQLTDIDIGPSSTDVKASGYFSNGKFLSLAMRKLVHAIEDNGEDPSSKLVTFQDTRRTNLREIYDNLLEGMRIAFRHFIGASSDADRASPLYFQAIDLFYNPSELPDGSSLFGMIFNSENAAVLGFGDSDNDRGDGERLRLTNVNIHNLRQNVNEVPAVYFDKCDNPDSTAKTVIKGPFGDVLDIRKMAGNRAASTIDGGEDFTALEYRGNVLADAQVSLALFGPQYSMDFGTVQSHHFLMWALDSYNGQSYDGLPPCTMFMCNGDIMLHTNKGLIGARFDNIEDIEIDRLSITHLSNESPISSYACGSYEGPHDGGSRGGVEMEGSMGTDVVAFSMYSGNAVFEGYNEISGIYSDYGSAMGMWFMDDAVCDFEDDSTMDMTAETILSGQQLTEREFKQLQADNKYPYPNNFFECNILLDRDVNDDVTLRPNPPNGVESIGCKQNTIANKFDPIDEDTLIEEAQEASEKNKNIDFEAVQTGRFSRTPKPTKAPFIKPTKAPKTPKPTKAPFIKPTKAPKTPKPTKAPFVKPTKAPKTPKPTKAPFIKPTKAPKTPKPTKAPFVKPTKAPKTPRPRPTRLKAEE